jgi:hypothetical protein
MVDFGGFMAGYKVFSSEKQQIPFRVLKDFSGSVPLFSG